MGSTAMISLMKENGLNIQYTALNGLSQIEAKQIFW